MKNVIKYLLIITIFIYFHNNSFSQKLSMIDNYNEFSIHNQGYTYNVGDTIIFYGIIINQDSSIISTRLFMYYDGEFHEHYLSEFVKKVFGSYSFMTSFYKYENGDFLFGFDAGGLYKYSKGKFSNYDSLFADGKLSKINGITSDKNGNIYIQNNIRLFKFDGKDIEKIFDDPSEYNILPNSLSNNSIFLIGDKLIFRNMTNRFSIYDFETGKVNDFKEFDDLLNNPSYYNLARLKKIGDELYLTYYSWGKYHFAKYDGTSLTNLDYYLDLVPLSDGYNFDFDNEGNLFLLTTYNSPKSTDSLYIIDKNLNVKNIQYHHLVKSLLSMSGVFKMSNGDIFISLSNRGLLKIHSPTSVESPSNLLFLNKIYPNPARDRFSIDFGVESVNLGNMKVEIYDYLGRSAGELNPEIVYDSSTGKGTMKCEAGNLPKGMYIVVLSNGKYNRTMTLFLN